MLKQYSNRIHCISISQQKNAVDRNKLSSSIKHCDILHKKEVCREEYSNKRIYCVHSGKQTNAVGCKYTRKTGLLCSMGHYDMPYGKEFHQQTNLNYVNVQVTLAKTKKSVDMV